MKLKEDMALCSSPSKGRTGGVRNKTRDFFNLRDFKNRRRELRRNATFPEQRLWLRLRDRRMQGYKFRRQFGVGKYIVDFYAPALKLVVEVDGDTHAGEKAEKYDEVRTKYLNSLGVTCIRFTNHEIMQNFDGALSMIWKRVEEAKSTETPP
jgi:very-short-patch-repair endonuclease